MKKYSKLSRDCYLQNLHHFIKEIDYIVQPVLNNKRLIEKYIKVIQDGMGIQNELKRDFKKDIKKYETLIKKQKILIKKNFPNLLNSREYSEKDNRLLGTFQKKLKEFYSNREILESLYYALKTINKEYEMLTKRKKELESILKKIN